MKFSPYYTEEVRKLNLFNLKCSSFSRLYVFLNFFIKHIFKDFIYLFEREKRAQVVQTGRGRGRSRLLAEQGTRCRARSQDPETMTWGEGRRLTD